MPTTLLNPYSVALKKEPFLTINSSPVYVDGDYKIYKFVEKHYLHTFKNIIISERGAPNKDILLYLKGTTKPKKDSTEYYHNKRALEAIAEGVEYAKMLNFKVI